mgnify:CR=1 FL=1
MLTHTKMRANGECVMSLNLKKKMYNKPKKSGRKIYADGLNLSVIVFN